MLWLRNEAHFIRRCGMPEAGWCTLAAVCMPEAPADSDALAAGKQCATSLQAYVPRSRMKYPYIYKDKNLDTPFPACHSEEKKLFLISKVSSYRYVSSYCYVCVLILL